MAILFDGERFISGIEADHKHEQDHELTSKVRAVHLELAEVYGWPIINANQPVEEVHNQLWNMITEKFGI
jgi:thymidylate kinase